MTRSTQFPLIAVLALLGGLSAFADGFQLRWAIEHEPHVVLHLSPDQITAVGRERKLVLTAEQRENLQRFAKDVPSALGVESLGEPDCSCHISSALWTATDQVTVWTERLARDKDGSKSYYEVRLKKGFFTADANGRIYSGGQPVTWEQFETAVKSKRDDEYIQLSLPPVEPPAFAARVRALKEKHHFYYRL